MSESTFLYEYSYERETAKIADTCEVCGCDIWEHEEYYDIFGTIVCMDCIQDFKKGGC